MNTEVIKLAQQTILQLKSDNDQLSKELDSYKESVKLAFNLLHDGLISVEQLESKISELAEKSQEDRAVFKKAAEFTKVAMRTDSFRISSDQTSVNMSPEDRFMASLFE